MDSRQESPVHTMFNSHSSARINPDIHGHAHKTSIGRLSATVQFALPNSKPAYPHFPVPVLIPSPSSGGIVINIRLSSPKRTRHAFIPPSRMKAMHSESGGRASLNHPAQRVARPSDEEQWKTMIGMLVRRGISVGSNG